MSLKFETNLLTLQNIRSNSTSRPFTLGVHLDRFDRLSCSGNLAMLSFLKIPDTALILKSCY